MEHIRQSLQQIVVDAVRRAPAEDVPLLAWPLACGAAVAEKTRAQLLSLTGEYLRQLREITDGRIQRLRFVLESELDKR